MNATAAADRAAAHSLRIGTLAVTLTSILWGTTGTAASFAPDAGTLAIGSAALGIGGLLQFAVAIPAVRRARSALWQHRGVIALGAVAVAMYPLAFYSSMQFAGIAIGSVVSLGSAPLVSGLLELVIDRRRLGPWWFVAASLAVAGGTLLTFSHDETTAGNDVTLGIVLGVVAGSAYAVYSWAAGRMIARGVPRAASMGAVFGVGGALLMPVLVITGGPLLESVQSFSVAAYMAIVPMFIGYLLFGLGLARIPASSATTITLLEPAVATLLAVVIVGEHVAPIGWIGMLAIGLALVVIARAPVSWRAEARDETDAPPVID